ncbi:MAG: PilZ domain-containing protein [Phycisphaerales bacterium]|nr:PilZ domain-containing protein [Phycisphaerales bacterium]
MGGISDEVCIERRQYERRTFDRACKLLHEPTLQFMAARTCDLSSGGALLELSHHRRLNLGDRVDVVIDWTNRGIVDRQAMLGATVVRLAGNEGLCQQVGVCFDRELTVAQAA